MRVLSSLAYLYISSFAPLDSSSAYLLVSPLAYSVGLFGFVGGLFVDVYFVVAIFCCGFT